MGVIRSGSATWSCCLLASSSLVRWTMNQMARKRIAKALIRNGTTIMGATVSGVDCT